MDAQTLLDNFDTIAEAPGGTDRLRGLILDLALAGRLVQADTDDEPVNALLERLRHDRERTIMEWGFRGQKLGPHAGSDELPHDLPTHWTWVRLAEIAHPQAGFAFKSTGFNEIGRGLPLVRIRDIGTGETECCFDGDFREEFVIDEGDYLVGMDGNFNIRRWEGARALLNQRVTRLVFFGDEVAQPFVVWALQREISKLHGSRAYTTVQHLSGKQIAGAMIPLPPLGEQERIVAKVDELMQLCDDLEARQQARQHVTTRLRASSLDALSNAETDDDLHTAWSRIHANWEPLTAHPDSIDALRQTILQLAVRGRLVESEPDDEPAGEFLKRARAERDRRRSLKLTRLVDDSADYERDDSALPAGWNWSPLQDLVQFIDYRGKTPKKTESGIPLITAKNIRRGWINREPKEFVTEATYSEWMTRGFPHVGDVLFTTEAPLGNAALVDIRDPFALAQRAICFSPYSNLHTPYLMHVLLSPWFAEELSRRATGMTATGIKASKLRLIRVPVPPVAEQQRIAARVDDLLAGCGRLETAQRQRLTSAQSVSEATVRLAS
jgi:type I restriction enzyme S subunit